MDEFYFIFMAEFYISPEKKQTLMMMMMMYSSKITKMMEFFLPEKNVYCPNE